MNAVADNIPSTSRLVCGSTERRVLIATARFEIDESASHELERLLRQSIDWDMLISQSVIHGTAGLLLRHLSAIKEVADIPEDVFERLRSIYMRIAVSGMQQIANFQKVAQELSGLDVKVILLKGAALAESLYGDLGLRPMSDVDILIHEKDWPKICKVLESYQYRSYGKDLAPLPPKLTGYDIQAHIQLLSPTDTCLEFQFDLFTMGIGMLDIAGVWERARVLENDGAGVLVLCPEDQLLHLLVHANRHGCSRLKWLVDIAESLVNGDDVDWDLLESIARREKVTAIVYETLSHTERLLERELVDPLILQRFAPSKYQEIAWNILWPQKRLDEFSGRDEDGICFYFYRPFSGWNLFNFVLTGRIKDKLSYQARWIIPSLEWMSDTYGTPKSLKLLKYYPIRLADRIKGRNAQ